MKFTLIILTALSLPHAWSDTNHLLEKTAGTFSAGSPAFELFGDLDGLVKATTAQEWKQFMPTAAVDEMIAKNKRDGIPLVAVMGMTKAGFALMYRYEIIDYAHDDRVAIVKLTNKKYADNAGGSKTLEKRFTIAYVRMVKEDGRWKLDRTVKQIHDEKAAAPSADEALKQGAAFGRASVN